MIENNLYLEDIKSVAESTTLDFNKFKNKKILITGATGLICSFLIDVLMYRNKIHNDNIKIYMIVRNEESAKKRFKDYNLARIDEPIDSNLVYIVQDVCEKLKVDIEFDYVIHGASNTHPLMYSTDPIGTITTNFIGLYNLLEYSKNNKKCRTFAMSSVEIYGENDGKEKAFSEESLGYINCNTLRAGYPESKRVCEALCQAYINKYDSDIVIGRLCRIYGPTMKIDDSKAIAQFIKKAVNNEDIVLKSNGEQYFSYLYVADAVSAILKIIFEGKNGEAYNIADEKSDITLKELANILAASNNKKVTFEIPDEKEKKGYSTSTVAILNADKLKSLNWKAKYDIKTGLEKTTKILKALSNEEK